MYEWKWSYCIKKFIGVLKIHFEINPEHFAKQDHLFYKDKL